MDSLKKFVNLYQQEGIQAIPRALEVVGIIPLPALFDKIWLDCSWLIPGSTNNLNLKVFALRRSGHHAILNWIRYQLNDRYCFLNECEVGQNPFTSCSRANSIVKYWAGEHHYLNWKQEQKGYLAKKGILIHNYEDGNFLDYVQQVSPEQERQWLGSSKNKLNIMILRDPFNLFASKLRWSYGNTLAPDLSQIQKLPEIWKIYAREFINVTNFLEDKITINYNSWFLERQYRDQLGSQIGFENRDLGINEVAKWGPTTWGDSFDGLKHDGQAQSMKVLERWQQYRDDPLFRSLFQDQELLELSEQIFGSLPGTDELNSSISNQS